MSKRTVAEASFAKAQKRAREAAQAMTEAETESKRVNDNTARLRALRLAKEAEDAVTAAKEAKAKARKAKAKPAAKRKVAAAK